MQAFDAGSGEPKRCVEMESWPRMERMIGTFGATVSRALLESFYATPSTEGLSVIFNRSAATASLLHFWHDTVRLCRVWATAQ